MKQRLFEIIQLGKKEDVTSRIYDWVMIIFVVVSLIPLTCMEEHSWIPVVNGVSVVVFIIDYLFRLYTADLYLKKGKMSYFLYPLTPLAVIDLLSILPYFTSIAPAFRVMRMFRLVKIVRLFKVLRYSQKMMAFIRVLQKERNILLSVLMIAVFYIFMTALIMFSVEPHYNPQTGEATFTSFFDALYWATVTLTTVGYGDLCPVTDIGRCISMLSSIFGVAIIALPSGVITASYLDELRNERNSNLERITGTDTGDSLRTNPIEKM